jgi:serine/threonine-protein kinase
VTAFRHPRYTLDRLIATGGMGEVWAATDTLLEREVAVKLLKREYAEDAVFRARFAAEARNAGSLQHPHVASVLDYGEIAPQDDGPGARDAPMPFLVMELVAGQPLSALLAHGAPLDPAHAAELIAQAGEGVAAAHRRGMVHRDVKPGNLLVTEQGRVKVTDFGVARAADTVPLTVTGHIIGTPHYLSPEQAEGRVATPASDVYALGIVLYECLVGTRPFVGDSPVATALMQIREPLPPFPDSVPQRLQDITRVATAKNPAARYPTAAAFAAALRDESPATQTIPVPTGRTAAAPPLATSAPASTAESRTALRRRPAAYIAAALALLLSTAAGWTMLTGDQPTQAPAAAATEKLVQVRAAAYVGEPVQEVTRRLRALGLRVDPWPRQNPGEGRAGTVAAVSPHGRVEVGSEIVLAVWGRPPAEGKAPAAVATGAPGTGAGSTSGSRTGSSAGSGAAPKAGNPTDGSQADQGKGNGSGKGGKGGSGKGGSKGGGKAGGKGGKGKGGKR